MGNPILLLLVVQSLAGYARLWRQLGLIWEFSHPIQFDLLQWVLVALVCPFRRYCVLEDGHRQLLFLSIIRNQLSKNVNCRMPLCTKLILRTEWDGTIQLFDLYSLWHVKCGFYGIAVFCYTCLIMIMCKLLFAWSWKWEEIAVITWIITFP